MTQEHPPQHDENALIAERRGKLAAMRASGIAFPNDFRRTHQAGDLQADTPLSGHFVFDTRKADTRGVLWSIEDARQTAIIRQQGRDEADAAD